MQCETWLKVVSNLRVDRKGTIAPHKPLLLLVLAELAEQGKLASTFLRLTGELVFRFLAYWTVVAERRPQRPDVHLPFYHMRSDGCWTPLDVNGQPTLERRRALAAILDETFFACLNDPDFRREMRRILIAKYFTDFAERAALYQLVGLPVPPDAIVKEDARLYEAARERGREARFRLTVGEKSRFRGRTNIFFDEQDEQRFEFGTVEETVGRCSPAASRLPTVHRGFRLRGAVRWRWRGRQ